MNKSFLLLLLPIFFCNQLVEAFNDEPNCYKELKTTFFQRRLLEQALSMYDVNQSQWPLIAQMLVDRSLMVPNIIKQRAQRMMPDPLEYPFNSSEAVKLLKQVLLEVFAQVMRESGIFNENVVRGMFEYVYKKQDARFEACIGVGTVH